MSLRFDNRVVVVTGAGNGIGRDYAHFFASRGAKVVVNDLGGSLVGTGQSTSAADKVVQEIKQKGGIAVANYDSVEFGEKIIKTAIDTFGRIDVLVNNAGIIRDISFQKMKDSDWDSVIKVHMYGPYKCARAAWNYMRQQGYGRIVNISSGSGLFGTFGQVNYSAAKLGIHGFTLALAKQGQKRNIYVNSVAPSGASRMLQTVMSPQMLATYSPKLVSPFVAYLCHESSKQNGGLFQVGGGFVAKLRWQRSQGTIFNPDTMSPQQISAKIKQITDFNRNSDFPNKGDDTFERIQKFRSGIKPKL